MRTLLRKTRIAPRAFRVRLAIYVSWGDAEAYVDRLVKKTGKPYRLLSEAEWEYAARGRTSPDAYPRFWFGDDEKALCRYGNGLDQGSLKEIAETSKNWERAAPCSDGYIYTSPAGHYDPNAFGLHDMFGNAAQWTADCYHRENEFNGGYDGAPADGSAWTTGDCTQRAIRGGSWDTPPGGLRSAQRMWYGIEGGFGFRFIGFRVARTLTP